MNSEEVKTVPSRKIGSGLSLELSFLSCRVDLHYHVAGVLSAVLAGTYSQSQQCAAIQVETETHPQRAFGSSLRAQGDSTKEERQKPTEVVSSISRGQHKEKPGRRPGVGVRSFFF